MKTERQLIEQFLEFFDEPGVKAEHLDPQMRELVEQMAFARQAFKYMELQSEEPDVESEWERFAAKNFGNKRTAQNHTIRLYKMAATFVGIIFALGVAFAAIHMVRITKYQTPESIQTGQRVSAITDSSPADTVNSDTTITTSPVVFDNVRLDEILPEIAAYYHAEVSFRINTVRQLRFHFVWKPEDGLSHAIEKLNRFESINVRLDKDDNESQPSKIIVE